MVSQHRNTINDTFMPFEKDEIVSCLFLTQQINTELIK